jgi:peptidoglycan/LPS O-acetylase OafA/YrhL
MWSIAVEWQIYFLFPLLLFFARRVSVVLTTATVVLGADYGFYALWTAISGPSPIDPNIALLDDAARQVVDYLALFALGMLAATIAYSHRRGWVALRTIVPWGALAIAFFVALFLGFRQNGELWVFPPLEFPSDLLTAGFVLALFLSAARTDRSFVGALLGAKPLAAIGRFSYSIYLVHEPLIAVLYQFVVYPYIVVPKELDSAQTLAVLAFGAAPLVVAASFLFFLAFERPFLNRPQDAKTVTRQLRAATQR